MGKLFTPQDVSSGFNTTNSLNTNFTNIETALDKCLSRTGETPNTMSAALDMNNNNLINAGLVSCDTLEVAGAEVPSLQSLQNLLDTTESDLAAQVTLAQGHATNASQSATDAATAQGLAEDAQVAAEAAASSTGLPALSPGDAGKTLEVNVTEDGYSLITPTEETSAATPSTVVVRDAAGRSQVVDPSVSADISTKGYVDGTIVQEIAELAQRNAAQPWLNGIGAVQQLTGSGNFTVPAGVYRLKVTVTGGGGGGGGRGAGGADGSAGVNSTFSVGSPIFIGGRGLGGPTAAASGRNGGLTDGPGGTIDIPGGGSDGSDGGSIGKVGGGSYWGGGGAACGAGSNGLPGIAPGSGGGGAHGSSGSAGSGSAAGTRIGVVSVTPGQVIAYVVGGGGSGGAGAQTGGNGAAGTIVIEY